MTATNPAWGRSLLSFAILLLITLPAFAEKPATPPTIAGHWEGPVQVPNNPLTMKVDLIENQDGDWLGQIAIPSQNLRDYPLSEVSIDGAKVHFVMAGVPGAPTFDGSVGTEGLTGTMTQGGQSFPFSFTRTGPTSYVPASPIAATDGLRKLAGVWRGAIEIPQAPNGKLRMVFHVDIADEVVHVRFVSPDQGNIEIPVSKIERDGDTVVFAAPTIGGRFEGTLDAGGTMLDGSWTQGPQALPLKLTRDPAAP